LTINKIIGRLFHKEVLNSLFGETDRIDSVRSPWIRKLSGYDKNPPQSLFQRHGGKGVFKMVFVANPLRGAPSGTAAIIVNWWRVVTLSATYLNSAFS